MPATLISRVKGACPRKKEDGLEVTDFFGVTSAEERRLWRGE